MKRKKAVTFPSRGHLAMNLQIARTLRGWSQETLALSCGLKRTYIGAIERAEINPGLDNLDRIANGLSVPSHVLLQSPDTAQGLLYKAAPPSED